MDKGMDILPVTVNGSRKVLPKKSLIFSPGTIEVGGDPIPAVGYTRESVAELMKMTRGVVIANYRLDSPG
jgi:1-acyl-sn-glycerol-3-phosphate acyltransferase